MVGKFLLGAVFGGTMVIGALVVGSALFPPAENRSAPAVDAAVVAAPEPVEAVPEVTAAVTAQAPEAEAETTVTAPETAEAVAEPKAETAASAEAEPVMAEPAVEAADPVAEAPTPGDLASDVPDAPPVPPRQLATATLTETAETPAAAPEVAAAQPDAATGAEQSEAMVDATETEAAPEGTVAQAPVLTVPLVTLPPPSFDTALLESAPVEPAPAAPSAEAQPTPPAVPEPAPLPEMAEAPAEAAVEPETAESAVEPAPDAPPMVEPLPEIAQIEPPETPEAAAPDQATPPDAETVRLPGTQAPAMPGTRPETLPGTVVTVDPPEAEVAAAEPAAPGVVTNRLPRIGDDPTTAEAADPAASADSADDPRPVARFAAPFDNPGDRPLLAVVLIDSGAPDLDRAALAALPFPVSIALDPMDTASAEHAAMYRQAGKEVIMLATGVAEGAQASDIEVAFQAMSQGLPEAVAVMELADPAFQDNRPLASIVVPVVQGDGRGLLTWDRGLNAADQVARRDGVPAATVFRDISSAAGDKFGMRRLMDRAMFKADQDGSATVVGEATPDLTATLLEWTLEGRGAPVTLAPLSAVLTVN